MFWHHNAFKSNASPKNLAEPFVGHAKILDSVRFMSTGNGGSSFEKAWCIEADRLSGDVAAAVNTGDLDGAGGIIILTEYMRQFEICIAGGAHALVKELLLLRSSSWTWTAI